MSDLGSYERSMEIRYDTLKEQNEVLVILNAQHVKDKEALHKHCAMLEGRCNFWKPDLTDDTYPAYD